jgi:uncharacterized protein with von Willebrand factor type A (vWA) domain
MTEHDARSREEIEVALSEAQGEHETMLAESKAKIRELTQALNMKLAIEEAERLTAGLSGEQRDQLAQLIQSNGIASTEDVGTPGQN